MLLSRFWSASQQFMPYFLSTLLKSPTRNMSCVLAYLSGGTDK